MVKGDRKINKVQYDKWRDKNMHGMLSKHINASTPN